MFDPVMDDLSMGQTIEILRIFLDVMAQPFALILLTRLVQILD